MGKRLIAIGEALIDFVPQQTGTQIKDTEGFLPRVGGAPTNVCGAYAKLGGEAVLLTQLGMDPFGDKIMEELSADGICVDHICRTQEANTSLAFVALMEHGEREFSFFRKPGADMLYCAAQVPAQIFDDAYALHFCSVSLGDFPMKEAHQRAISYARRAGTCISFDPNLRKQLWEDENALADAVQTFLPYADILKISEEELEFITGKQEIEDALDDLFAKEISVVLYTRGSAGASVYTRKTEAHVPGSGRQAIDTTGAGDGFIGSFLYRLSSQNCSLAQMRNMTSEQWQKYLAFSNTFCGISVQKKGAICSYPTMREMECEQEK